jgi:hypothetical protein
LGISVETGAGALSHQKVPSYIFGRQSDREHVSRIAGQDEARRNKALNPDGSLASETLFR